MSDTLQDVCTITLADMEKLEIGYVTESPAREYAKMLRSATTNEELVRGISFYEQVADDALAQAKKLTVADFKDFQRDIRKANRKMPDAWTERFVSRFGDIALPMKMMTADMVAQQYHAPWGCAVIRCEEDKWAILKARK